MNELQDASKKRKRNAERARVTRACDRCKKRKIKCNGVQPCDFCRRADAECTFDTAYARGKAPPILSAQDGLEGSDHLAHETSSSGHPLAPEGTHALSSLSPSAPAQSPTSPKSSLTGLHGQYIGPASGVSFLQRVQKRLGQTASFSRPGNIFTFGDPPFAEPEGDPFLYMMLPREDAQQLVNRYFDYAMPTYRFLHRPTIQKWFAEFYDTFGMMHDAQRAPAKTALLLMVLAHARVYMPDDKKPGPPDLSQRLYVAAERQILKENGSIRLTSIQARLTQCYYLLTQSRINHCWSTFGTVTQLALAAGLNRSRKTESRVGTGNIEVECRRRTFWCAYTLDVHLSVVLGRPQLFNDEDIDVELPTDVEDELIQSSIAMGPEGSRSSSTMFASLAHIKLARIVKQILRGLYPLKPIAADLRLKKTRDIDEKLSIWRSDLTSFLDTRSFNASMFLPIVQRQRNVLNLTYRHAVILTHRPYLLNIFAAHRQTGRTDDDDKYDEQQVATSVQQCLSNAMQTVETISHMTQSGQMSRAFWIAAYFAFTAITVLYIYVIQNRSRSRESYVEYLSAAILCQSHISHMAEKGSLSERYCLLLEELRLEAIHQTSSARRPTPNADASCTTDANAPLAHSRVDYAAMQGFQADLEENLALPTTTDMNALFSDVTPDYGEWDQFASILASGLGNLEGLICEDFAGQFNEYAPS